MTEKAMSLDDVRKLKEYSKKPQELPLILVVPQWAYDKWLEESGTDIWSGFKLVVPDIDKDKI